MLNVLSKLIKNVLPRTSEVDIWFHVITAERKKEYFPKLSQNLMNFSVSSLERPILREFTRIMR